MLLVLAFSGFVAFGQKGNVRKVQQFSRVYYQYPMQFLRNGIKSMVEFNMDERYILGVQVQSSYSFYPLFYDEPGTSTGGGLSVNIYPNYFVDNNIKLVYKNYVGNYGYSFHGYYVGLFAQRGNVREAFQSQLAANFRKTLITNNYKYNRFGIITGRQWTLYNVGVLDFNIGLGYNQMDMNAERQYTPVAPFDIKQNSAYFTSNIALGIGKWTEDQRLPKLPTLKDSLILNYGLLLDFNAIINSGIELNILHHNRKKHLLRNYLRIRRFSDDGINITSADSFNSVMIGMQYRHYPTASLYRSGVYFAGGYAYEHSNYVFNESFDGESTKKIQFDPHTLDFTVGFTTIIDHRFMLDFYVSNMLTLSKGKGKETYPRINDATGFRSEVGFKLGLAKFFKKWN